MEHREWGWGSREGEDISLAVFIIPEAFPNYLCRHGDQFDDQTDKEIGQIFFHEIIDL